MKNLKIAVLSVLAALALALPAAAQTALTQTRLSAAVPVGSGTITIKLASTTNIATGTALFIEDGTSGSPQIRPEMMLVLSVPVSGQATVLRGYDNTVPVAHISLAVVLAGPPSAFFEVDPVGACTATQTLSTPYVNVRTGSQWLCSTITNSWVSGFFNQSTPPGVTTAVASVAGATLPSGPLFHVTGTNAITAWGSSTTVGAVGAGGSTGDAVGAPFCVIPDAIFTTTATNNIALATTAVVNKLLCYTFDQTNKKYVPSY